MILNSKEKLIEGTNKISFSIDSHCQKICLINKYGLRNYRYLSPDNIFTVINETQ